MFRSRRTGRGGEEEKMFRDAKLVQKLILGYKMDASLFSSKISFELRKTDVLGRFSEVKLVAIM